MGLPTIRKQHLVLQPWTHTDIDALHALWTSPEVRRYPRDDLVIMRDVAERLVDSHIATADQHGIWYWVLHMPPVSLAETPVAGFCGFRFIDDGPEIELVYGLQAEHWGKGPRNRGLPRGNRIPVALDRISVSVCKN